MGYTREALVRGRGELDLDGVAVADFEVHRTGSGFARGKLHLTAVKHIQ